MLRVTDAGAVEHVDPRPFHTVQAPGRREVLAAFREVLGAVEQACPCVLSDHAEAVSVIERFLATRL